MKLTKLSKLTTDLLISDLKKDLNGLNLQNDLTTKNLVYKKEVEAHIICKEKIVFCGGELLKQFIQSKFSKLKIQTCYTEGKIVKKNSILMELYGDVRLILTIERTILNFLQHLCSISTTTNLYVSKLKGTKTKLLDTRKTTSGLRELEKYATKIGGAKNHRVGLYDDFLIKDNHLRALGGIQEVLKVLKEKKIQNYKIECDSFPQVKMSVESGAKYLLLDNMSPKKVKQIIKIFGNKIKFEISGGINLKNISKYAKVGANFISTSKITLSAKSVDIGLDII